MRKVMFLGLAILMLASVYSLGLDSSTNASSETTLRQVVKPQVPTQPKYVDRSTVTPHSMLEELNSRRKAAGLPLLKLDERLNQSAQDKCDDMYTNKYYDHREPVTGVRGYELAREAFDDAPGTYGENLNSRLKSTATPIEIFDSWFVSEPHKKAALNPNYTLTGFGYCTATANVPTADYRTVVQHFYGPPS